MALPIDNNIRCGICLEDMEQSAAFRRINCRDECNLTNRTHEACFKRWTDRRQECPFCRTTTETLFGRIAKICARAKNSDLAAIIFFSGIAAFSITALSKNFCRDTDLFENLSLRDAVCEIVIEPLIKTTVSICCLSSICAVVKSRIVGR